jgi:hypothetical protein
MTTHKRKYLLSKGLDPNLSLNMDSLSRISGIDRKDLEQIKDRGEGAWSTNIASVRVKGTFKKDPKVRRSRKLSAQQWGIARVYAFLNKMEEIKAGKRKRMNQDTDIYKRYKGGGLDFKKSTRKDKKYMVRTPKGKLIHFGQIGFEQFKDSTGLGLYSHLDHGDKNRRRLYRLRHRAIKTKDGKPAYKDKESSSYYSWNYLW